jgi:predicted RNase H-like HicB family nuclease
MKHYEANVRQGENHWIVTVPKIGAVTQARTINELNTMTKDLIEITTDDKDFDISFDYDLPSEVAEAVELKRQAVELEARAMATQIIAAKKLHELGVSLRDIGKLLGISHQRAHQLIKA